LIPFPFDKDGTEVVFDIELGVSKMALAVVDEGWDCAGKLEDSLIVMIAGS
jgi:hypothetical protein